MNWRNPFLITYLAVTVVGVGICGYLLYSGYNHYSEVATNYDDAVLKLRKLQNHVPFPSTENNEKYKEFTKQYQAEYDKLVQKVSSMQKSVQDMSPQAFQDLLRASVSQVEAAAKENGVALPQNFYLGFDQYQGTLPADSAAGPLARQLAAIRIVVDDLILLKSKQILGIKRDLLPQEGGAAPAESAPQTRGPGGRQRQGGGERGSGGSPVVASPFEVAFVADQSVVRSALNYIVNSDQFFIIRDLNVQNSALEGPKKVEDPQPGAAAPAADASTAPTADASAPAQPEHTLRVLVGREKLTVALRIEMITFNNLPSQK
jgi:hypothetical protein